MNPSKRAKLDEERITSPPQDVYIVYNEPPEENINEGDSGLYKTMYDLLEEGSPKRERNRQIRFREIKELRKENLKKRIMNLIRKALGFKIVPKQIISAERRDRWENKAGPRDVLVTFSSKKVRDKIYSMRQSLDFGKHIIVDELDVIDRVLWNRGVDIYGIKRLFTYNGCVAIESDNHQNYSVRTLKDLYDLAEQDRRTIFED